MEQVTFDKVPISDIPAKHGDYIVIDGDGQYRVMTFGEMYEQVGWRDEMQNAADNAAKFWLREVF